MRRLGLHAALVGVLLVVVGVGSYAIAGDGNRQHLEADRLVGFEENPDISTVAKGRFEATINRGAKTISFKLSYSRLEGDVQQAHIHFGKRAVNGGISVFLCSNLPDPPPDTAPCPQSGTVRGVIEAADIIGPVPQGIEAMAFDELVAALRGGHTYANVHSSKWPGGEIRAQIKKDNGDDDD
jgi:CHRD domain-containing protein